MSEWTPTDDEAASMFITGWCCDTDPETGKTQPDEAWSRWLAAHDREIREEIEREVRADMFRGVRAWVERFTPGDRWDPQDAIDLESALLGIVEANPDRSRARGEEQTDD